MWQKSGGLLLPGLRMLRIVGHLQVRLDIMLSPSAHSDDYDMQLRPSCAIVWLLS